MLSTQMQSMEKLLIIVVFILLIVQETCATGGKMCYVQTNISIVSTGYHFILNEDVFKPLFLCLLTYTHE